MLYSVIPANNLLFLYILIHEKCLQVKGGIITAIRSNYNCNELQTFTFMYLLQAHTTLRHFYYSTSLHARGVFPLHTNYSNTGNQDEEFTGSRGEKVVLANHET